ncbi:MAG: thioredoxin family protein [Burkholderiaceae bacterium]|nr:thioredoxin family protein [Burkholderiaceae bacterium]
MNHLILNSGNRATLAQWLAEDACVVACLCAAWCDTCSAYKSRFAELAAMHPEQRFVWIDIEDEADLVGDIDVDNFPTLLMQQSGIVSFFGTVLPDLRQADLVLKAQLGKSIGELAQEAGTSEDRKDWQRNYSLRKRLS